MEFITILLSGLLAVVSPVGVVIDKVIESNLRSRLNKVEQLQVRVDNTPSYQALQGKVEKVRIAGRGLWLTPNVRIEALELETDPINLDLQRLRQGSEESPRTSLRQPVQAGLRLVLTEADLNQTLQSPTVTARLRSVAGRLLGGSADRYEFLNPRVDLLDNDRIRFQVEVQETNAELLAITVESGLNIVAGQSLQLIEPSVSINGRVLPPVLVGGFAGGIGNRFNLRTLEDAGITARILQLDINADELEIAAFVRADPSSRATASTIGVHHP